MTTNELTTIASNPNTSAADAKKVMRFVSRELWQVRPATFAAERAEVLEAFRSNPARQLWALEDLSFARAIFNQ